MMMHFLAMGEVHFEPILFEEALQIALWGGTAARPVSTIEQARLMKSQHEFARHELRHHMWLGEVAAFVHNPQSGRYVKIPSMFWGAHYANTRVMVEVPEAEATGWEAALAGQPIIVRTEDLELIGRLAKAAAAEIAPAKHGNDNPTPKAKRQTKPRSGWYPMLVDEVKKEKLRRDHKVEMGREPPLFPKAPFFKRLLIKRGVPAPMLKDRTLRESLERAKEEIGVFD